MWEDEGRLRVVVAQPNVSIAQVVNSCNYMQRGDIVLPFNERPAPPLKSEANFDRFAPPSGKPVAMVVSGKSFAILDGTNDIIYVNLGTSQGVKVGDYYRVFRYQGTEHETAYQTKRSAFDMLWFRKRPSKISMGQCAARSDRRGSRGSHRAQFFERSDHVQLSPDLRGRLRRSRIV